MKMLTALNLGGTLTINSSDPFAPPLIDPAFFTAPVDIAAARDAIRNVRKFYGAKAFEGYIVSEAAPSAGAESDDELDAVISAIFGTTWHPTSTAKMSPKGADYGVVDPDLKVKGVRGLRIVDASVMVSTVEHILSAAGESNRDTFPYYWKPYVPSCHTQTAVYVIAERAADMIKQDWKS
jgi:choline dehydrogenase-like flavoprotein